MHDDQFTATGPSHHTSGFPKTAFSTGSPSDFLHGLNVQAARCGVVGEGLQAETETPPGSSDFAGIGVEGRGPNVGVVGIGRHEAIACVYGHGNRCKIGVLGAVMDSRKEEPEPIGVVGASIKNIGNPLLKFKSIPEPADGSGTGVLGTSGSGPGVSGTSSEGNGGAFSSQSGAGVFAKSSSGVALDAISDSNRGGVFQSGHNVAQIKLVPLVQGTQEPQPPKQGDIGDLLLIRNLVTLGVQDKCSLWLCVPGAAGPVSGIAYWQEIRLGPPVAGTV